MFEITLSSARNKYKHISFLIDKIRPKLKTINAVMVCEDFDGRENLAIASKNNDKDLILSFVFDAVSEAIIRTYKEEILFENLKNKIQDNVLLITFIKALTMYDKTSDKEFILSKLTPSKTINIDSLYFFKLRELTNRWVNIADLLSENSSFLMMSGTFNDLIKFLISSNDVEFGDVILNIEKGNIVGKSIDGTKVFCLEYNNDDSSKIKLVSELIFLAPNKIILSKDFNGLDITKYLEFIYDGKISILK